jgi:hypothetical protein
MALNEGGGLAKYVGSQGAASPEEKERVEQRQRKHSEIRRANLRQQAEDTEREAKDPG